MREMKDSGLSWITHIPSSWETSTIKALFTFGKGLPITKENLIEFGIPVISYGQIHAKWNTGVTTHEELKRYVDKGYLESYPDSLVNYGDFIFADTSEDREGCGNCAYIDTNGILFAGYHTIILKSRETNENKYLAYLFRTDSWRSQLRSKVAGVKLFSISRKMLGSAQLIIPPQEEQNRICKLLDKKCGQIDTLINNLSTQVDMLKQYKQSLITEAVTRGLDSSVSMKDSGIEWIGSIPMTWNIHPSKSLFQDCKDRRHQDDEQLTASQKYGMISQVEYMELEKQRVVLADKGLENWKHVEPGDFVISLRSFQGGLELTEVAGCVTWHYIVLRAKRKIDVSYFKWLFKSKSYITALQRTCNYIRDGQDLRYGNFIQVPLCVPPLHEQIEIGNYLNLKTAQIDSLISVKQSKIAKLTEYRKALIYEYVTGKKEVV